MPKTNCFFIHLTVLDAVLDPLLWFFRFFASLRIVDSLFGFACSNQLTVNSLVSFYPFDHSGRSAESIALVF